MGGKIGTGTLQHVGNFVPLKWESITKNKSIWGKFEHFQPIWMSLIFWEKIHAKQTSSFFFQSMNFAVKSLVPMRTQRLKKNIPTWHSILKPFQKGSASGILIFTTYDMLTNGSFLTPIWQQRMQHPLATGCQAWHIEKTHPLATRCFVPNLLGSRGDMPMVYHLQPTCCYERYLLYIYLAKL